MLLTLNASFTKMKKKTKYNKKAQLKIQEMAFMLVGVMLFFALAGMFAMVIVYSGMYKSANEASERKTITLITSLADSPEFSCVSSKSNCVDGDKAISLINKTVYADFWEFSSLRIVIRHSAFNRSISEMIPCSMANYPECDVITVYDKKADNEISQSSFVAFCRKAYEDMGNLGGYTYDKCEIGMIIAGSEEEVPESARLVNK